MGSGAASKLLILRCTLSSPRCIHRLSCLVKNMLLPEKVVRRECIACWTSRMCLSPRCNGDFAVTRIICLWVYTQSDPQHCTGNLKQTYLKPMHGPKVVSSEVC